MPEVVVAVSSACVLGDMSFSNYNLIGRGELDGAPEAPFVRFAPQPSGFTNAEREYSHSRLLSIETVFAATPALAPSFTRFRNNDWPTVGQPAERTNSRANAGHPVT